MYYIIACAEASSNLGRFDGIRYGYRTKNFTNLKELYENSRSEGFGAEVKRRIILGTYVLSSGYYDAYYKKAQKVRTVIKQEFEKLFEKFDMLLTPTSPTVAYKIGTKSNNPLEMYLADLCTVSVNIAGLPGISIPCGVDSKEAADKVRKWSTQARENAPWYQHEELGYNYRMSNVIAGVVRGQFPYLEEHIAQKKAVYERYKEGLKDLPVEMNPFDAERCEPNYWLSAMIIKPEAMCKQVRGEQDVCYVAEHGKSCPTEILEAIFSINAEGRPIWKPMHMQPMYRMHEFVTVDGSGRCRTNAYIAGGVEDVGADIFQRGLCLPSDNKMTAEEQERIIEVIKACFE